MTCVIDACYRIAKNPEAFESLILDTFRCPLQLPQVEFLVSTLVCTQRRLAIQVGNCPFSSMEDGILEVMLIQPKIAS